MSKSSFLKVTQKFVIQRKCNGIMIAIHQKVSHGSVISVHGVITCNASEQSSVPTIPRRFTIYSAKRNSRMVFIHAFFSARYNNITNDFQLYYNRILFINYNCIMHIVIYVSLDFVFCVSSMPSCCRISSVSSFLILEKFDFNNSFYKMDHHDSPLDSFVY
jgi:hypothetical protein